MEVRGGYGRIDKSYPRRGVRDVNDLYRDNPSEKPKHHKKGKRADSGRLIVSLFGDGEGRYVRR